MFGGESRLGVILEKVTDYATSLFNDVRQEGGWCNGGTPGPGRNRD